VGLYYLFIHSFIVDIYLVPLQVWKVLRSAPNPSMAK